LQNSKVTLNHLWRDKEEKHGGAKRKFSVWSLWLCILI